MPLYDYHCADCGVVFELLVRTGDVPACPGCGTTKIGRLVSRTAPIGKTKEIARQMRAAARREGHLSNFD